MTKYLTILCVAAVATGARGEDWRARAKNNNANAQAQTQTTVSRPVTTNRSFHPNTTVHSTGVQNLNTQRFQRFNKAGNTQLSTNNSIRAARFHNSVSTANTVNTNNSTRFQRFNNTTNAQLNTTNNARFQRFNHANVNNNTNVTVNNNRWRNFSLTGNPNAPRVSFRAGNRIAGASHWNGAQYSAFRNYSAQWHDRAWWHHHHSRIVFVLGGWYYWDAGWWYPAYGYAPESVYYWDGPIYGYNDLPPDQVVANVQASLQAQGYYQGEIDGVMGPLTRAAIASYQQEHGLLVTSAIDQPTMSSLGFS